MKMYNKRGLKYFGLNLVFNLIDLFAVWYLLSIVIGDNLKALIIALMFYAYKSLYDAKLDEMKIDMHTK